MLKTNPIVNTAAWLIAISVGFVALLRFEAGAGPTTAVRKDWPRASALQPGPTPFTLMVFIHPQCPCSNATVTELARVMAKSDKVSAQVLFIRPKGFKAGWENTNLWSRAAAIPGVVASVDEEGRECANFGVKTSGECALFNRQGNLLFSGGITAARGHEGDNRGSDIVAALISGAESQMEKSLLTTDTFGCPLFGCKAPNIDANFSEDTH